MRRRLAGRALAAALLAGGLLLAGPLFTSESAEQRGLKVWRGMEEQELELRPGGDAPPRRLAVKVADEPSEWQQGMQHLPVTAIREHPIWFVFPEPITPSFHMHNVAAALDIVWVDDAGRVLAVDRMVPETAGYRPPGAIRYVLETAAGQAVSASGQEAG